MALSDRQALMGVAPRLNPGADVRMLRLDSHEGFLLSQIDGTTPAADLADVVAMDADVLATVLGRLERMGVIVWAGDAGGDAEATPSPAAKPKPAPAAKPKPTLTTPAPTPPTPVPTPAAKADPALGEACDLTDDEKSQILEAERSLDTQTHWDRLRLAGKPTAADIKRAYFVASKRFHPDRYFGRELGSFKDRLERIFQALKTSHDVLRDPEKCAAYAKKHPPPKVAAAPEAAAGAGSTAAAPKKETAAEKRARLDARRKEIMADRRQKRWNRHFGDNQAPQSGKVERAKEMYNVGLTQLRSGQAVQAAASLKLATTWDPSNEQYRAMFEEANKGAVLERARQIAKEAEDQVAMGHAGTAAESFARAFELVPDRVEYAVRATEEYLGAGKLEAAVQIAEQAVEMSPNRIDARYIAAAAHEKLGNIKTALENARAAERLDNSDARVKKMLKRLTKKRR